MNTSAVRAEDWLTVNQAAERLGVSRQTVLNRALAGELETMRIGSRHFVKRASVDAALRAFLLSKPKQ